MGGSPVFPSAGSLVKPSPSRGKTASDLRLCCDKSRATAQYIRATLSVLQPAAAGAIAHPRPRGDVRDLEERAIVAGGRQSLEEAIEDGVCDGGCVDDAQDAQEEAWGEVALVGDSAEDGAPGGGGEVLSGGGEVVGGEDCAGDRGDVGVGGRPRRGEGWIRGGWGGVECLWGEGGRGRGSDEARREEGEDVEGKLRVVDGGGGGGGDIVPESGRGAEVD